MVLDIDIQDLLMMVNLMNDNHHQNMKTLSDDVYILCNQILRIGYQSSVVDTITSAQINLLFGLNSECPICKNNPEYKRFNIHIDYMNGCCIDNHYPPLFDLIKNLIKHSKKPDKIRIIDNILDNRDKFTSLFKRDKKRKILKGNFEMEFILLKHLRNKLIKNEVM